MKTFTTFNQPSGWPSIAAAYRDDLQAGHTIQASPWGGLVILGHAELMAFARHPSADGMAPSAGDMAATPRLHDLLMRALFTRSGAVHRAQRTATLAALAAVNPRGIVRASLPFPAAATGRADVRREIVAPVVEKVWAGIIGYTPEEAARLSRAVADMSAILSPVPDLSGAAAAEAAADEALAVSRDVCARGSPFADALLACVDGDTAAALIAGMAFDAVETSTTGITAALRIAASNRDRLAPMIACAAECLRLSAPSPMTMRLAASPFQICGVEVAAGTPLALVWAAGNHDPRAFADPERFDPARSDAAPLTFGMGSHACLGHVIAKTTLQALLAFILDRNVRIDGHDGTWNILEPADMPDMTAAW